MSNDRPSPSAVSKSPTALAAALALSAALAAPASVQAQAQAAPPAGKPAAAAKAQHKTAAVSPDAARKPARQAARKPAAPEPEPVVAAADATQLSAQQEVMLGASQCEFGQRINVDSNSKHPGYVDLSFNNRTYLMKPVLSSTGALRLEDVRAEALLIQIGSKTMLMNQKTGQRLVDNCIHPKHQVAAANQGPGLGVEPRK